jgi:hypothetical protein
VNHVSRAGAQSSARETTTAEPMTISPFARAALLAVAAACSLVSATAQMPYGCRDSCANQFGPPQRSVVTLSRGCIVRITWISRPSCVVGFDMVVLEVEPLTDGCGGATVARLVNEATDVLVASKASPFYTMGAPRDTCVAVGRAVMAACWRYRVECGDTTAVPCDSTSCCESTVMVCVDELFRRRFERRGRVLRAPCDPRTSCPMICGTESDSTGHDWTPSDTPPPEHDDVPTFSDGDTTRQSDAAAPMPRRNPPWPWRDPRPLRQPVRETRDGHWRLASHERHAVAFPLRRPLALS